MALNKKMMILVSPELHRKMKGIATKRHVSVGALVREACQLRYGGPTVEERLAAVERLSKLNAPVADVATMKRESVPQPKPLP